MIPKKIFLDLDDVLNKFTMWALRYVGCPIGRELDYAQYDLTWGYDIVRAANELHPDRCFSVDQFWDCFDQGAWATVPLSDEFHVILCASRAIVGTKNVFILTRPVAYPGCLEGKRQWIKQFMPSEMEENYLIGKDKYLCGTNSPEHLLIDDVEKNVDNWRAAGGSAVLFPRPWNGKWGVEPGRYIADLFAKIGSEMQKERDRARRKR
jgi:hypothetical protein